MAAKMSKKEVRARILGFVSLGAIVALSVTYLIAPRFTEPSKVMQQARSEVENKIDVNEDIALLQGQEDSLDKILEEIEATATALPQPQAVDSDRELKLAVEEMINRVGLSSNALKVFATPAAASKWTAISNPAEVHDPSRATGASVAQEGGNVDLTAPMYQKSLLISVQGPQDRLLQILRRLPSLDRAIVIDEFEIIIDQEFADPTLIIEARIFLMPAVDSPLVEEPDDGGIDEVETPFGDSDTPVESSDEE